METVLWISFYTVFFQPHSSYLISTQDPLTMSSSSCTARGKNIIIKCIKLNVFFILLFSYTYIYLCMYVQIMTKCFGLDMGHELVVFENNSIVAEVG